MFISIFALIFIAELPGKSTFASLLLATRAKPLPVFLGACAAYAVHSAFAVAAGRLVGLLPVRPVEVIVGTIFLVLAALLWRHQEIVEAGAVESGARFTKTTATAFTVVFLAQWGDPTQIATAALAAKYSTVPWVVFFSATLALWTVTGLAVVIGHFVKKRVDPGVLHKIVAVIFAGIGFALLAHVFRH